VLPHSDVLYLGLYGVAFIAAGNRVYRRYGALRFPALVAVLGGAMTLLSFYILYQRAIDSGAPAPSRLESDFLGAQALILIWCFGLALYACLALLYLLRPNPEGLPRFQSKLLRVLVWGLPIATFLSLLFTPFGASYFFPFLIGILMVAILGYGLMIPLAVGVARILQGADLVEESQLKTLEAAFD
jgi:hypothetical protein